MFRWRTECHHRNKTRPRSRHYLPECQPRDYSSSMRSNDCTQHCGLACARIEGPTLSLPRFPRRNRGMRNTYQRRATSRTAADLSGTRTTATPRRTRRHAISFGSRTSGPLRDPYPPGHSGTSPESRLANDPLRKARTNDLIAPICRRLSAPRKKADTAYRPDFLDIS